MISENEKLKLDNFQIVCEWTFFWKQFGENIYWYSSP